APSLDPRATPRKSRGAAARVRSIGLSPTACVIISSYCFDRRRSCGVICHVRRAGVGDIRGMKRLLHLLGVGLGGLLLLIAVGELTRKSLSVEEDPLIRMPGTQPSTGVVLEDVRACMACHSNYNPDIEPGFNWQGSMMAQAARDFLFWPAMAVAGQDSQWATGRPVAMDLCLRCHMPGGWLAGRSEPVNATAMTGPDFDGVQCDMCHRMYDPFFEDTFRGVRESDDWLGYWDESGASS